jgi:hypothetical protein
VNTSFSTALLAVGSVDGSSAPQRESSCAVPESLRAGRGGQTPFCFGDVLAVIAGIRASAKRAVLTFELVRERVILRGAREEWEEDA